MKRDGYLLIELIIAISIFGLLAGVATQGILLGLAMNSHTPEIREGNTTVLTNCLINKIRKATATPGNTVALKHPTANDRGNEEWSLKINDVKSPSNLIGGSVPIKNLYSLDVEIKNLKDITAKKYTIFRYLP